MTKLVIQDAPDLDRPILVLAFSGWADAGDVSTGTLDYLYERLAPPLLASMDAEPFISPVVIRPEAVIHGGRLERLSPSTYEFKYWVSGVGDPDMVFFQGPEPHLGWGSFCDGVIELARSQGVSAVFTLGGTYDSVAHWLPPKVSVVYSDKAAEKLMDPVRDEVFSGEYAGAVSIHTRLLKRGREAGLPVIGLWGHAPMYLQTGNVKIHRAMIEIIKRAVGITLDTADMRGLIKDTDRRIDELIANTPKLMDYINEMKNTVGEGFTGGDSERSTGAPSNGDRGKVISLNDFLRKDES